jgi:integrase/recombinase XerD
MKVWLEAPQVVKIFDEARARSPRDFLLLNLFRWGLTVGEVVGYRALPGIYKEDLRENGVWIRGKGWAGGAKTGGEIEARIEGLYKLPPDVLQQLAARAAALGPGRKVFDLSARQTERLVKDYARRAGVQDWHLVGPHRLRAFFATDARDKGLDGFLIRDLMRHKSEKDTNTYIGRASGAKIQSAVDDLSRTA